MNDLESIFPVIANDKDLQFFIECAEKHGIVRGGRGAWKLLRQSIVDSNQIPKIDIDEFTIHLRLLADQFLIFAQGERNLPDFIEQCRGVNDSRLDALKHAKDLRKLADRDSVKNIFADGGTALKAALEEAISTIDEEISRHHIPTSSRNPVRRSNHALVQTFESIWNLYASKPVKGNRKAYVIAEKFLECAGYAPRGETLPDPKQAFKEARIATEQLGPLTTVRRFTAEEKRVFMNLVF